MMQTQDKNIESKDGTERQSLRFATERCRRINSNLQVSARMNLILLFEDATSISISGPLSKERRIAAYANPEMSRTVMQLQ